MKNWERLSPENFITDKEGYIMYLRHMILYDIAKTEVNTDSVCLDIGSGDGYGCDILSKIVKNVVGLDIDYDIIRYSREKHKRENLVFVWGDGANMPFGNETFDFAICTHTIEHIENDVVCISEISRVLKSGGIFMIATPNKAIRQVKKKPWNRYHVREYNKNELMNLLKDKFTQVEIKGTFAIKEIMDYEHKRIRKYAFLNKFNIFGIRKLIPTNFETFVLDVITKLTRNRLDNQNFTDYKLKELYLSGENVDNCLDLVGVCVK